MSVEEKSVAQSVSPIPPDRVIMDSSLGVMEIKNGKFIFSLSAYRLNLNHTLWQGEGRWRIIEALNDAIPMKSMEEINAAYSLMMEQENERLRKRIADNEKFIRREQERTNKEV